jgi:hypothetical protein
MVAFDKYDGLHMLPMAVSFSIADMKASNMINYLTILSTPHSPWMTGKGERANCVVMERMMKPLRLGLMKSLDSVAKPAQN